MARVDKFIWAVRLAKTRSIATEMCKKNKVLINNVEVKPSKLIKVGDELSIKKSAVTFSYKVLQDIEKRVGAKLVLDYIIDITPIEEVEKYKTILLTQKTYRQNGLGRPTKKQRRDIDRFLR
ncbi:MAG TPA: RNA-binding S4 domain-containing protein [Crocinitomix sp.]|nr:RNA-binding S4 domain-containing protein [Crocinitomix sp.]